MITAAFIDYLVAGLPGAVIAAAAIFTPIWLGAVLTGRWSLRHRDNPRSRRSSPAQPPLPAAACPAPWSC